MVQAGTMRHRITIQTPTRTADGQGGVTTVWSTLVTTWADVRPLTSREQFYTAQIFPAATHRATIRHRSGVSSGNRVIYDSRTWTVKGPPQDRGERGRLLDLTLEEVTT